MAYLDLSRSDCLIYVCSRNPIAVWAINHLLAQSSFSRKVLTAFAKPLPIVSHSVNIALFDASSIPEWPAIIPRWVAADYRAILVGVENWSFEGAELRALRLGVTGILDVTTEFDSRLVDAITIVANGQLFARQEIVAKPHCASSDSNASSDSSRLSFREGQVIDLVRLGFSNKQIATTLGISERTAKFHVCNILHKLHVTRRAELRTIARHAFSEADLQRTAER